MSLFARPQPALGAHGLGLALASMAAMQATPAKFGSLLWSPGLGNSPTQDG